MSRMRGAILLDEDGEYIDVQNPVPCGCDSVYAKDIWIEESISTGWTGEITNPFDNLHTEIRNDSSDNPKELLIHFERTLYANSIGFGSSVGGEFSNLKIEFIGSGGVVRYTFDQSSDNTKRTSYLANIPSEGTLAFNAMRLLFYTADPISITNITIRKESVTQSTIRGVKSSGSVTNIGATNNNNLKISLQEYGDTAAVDAFARLRTSNPFTLFDSKQIHDKQPLFWDESIGGAASSTHSTVNAETVMAVTASANDFVIRQTKQRFHYQAGKSQLVFMTFNSPQYDGITSRVGLFDGTGTNNLTPYNGIFFECNGDLSFNIAKNGTITETVIQSNWNVDPLDGTGTSGIILDVTASQILIFDYEWGVGRARVGFIIDGLVYYCHYFNHSNIPTFTSVYMSSPNLPLRYSIESDGTTTGQLSHICASIISEGGDEKAGVLRSANTGLNFVTTLAANTDHAIVGLRLKTVYKDITLIPKRISAISGTNDDFRWSLQLNPVVAGTFTYAGITDSAAESAIGTAANTITTPGLILASGFSRSEGNVDSALDTSLRLGSTIAGVQDEIVLCISPFGSNASVSASLDYRELL